MKLGKEKKRTYSFKGKPSIVDKAKKKVVTENKTLSEKIENLLEDYVSIKKA